VRNVDRTTKSARASLRIKPGSLLLAASLMTAASACSAKTDAPAGGVMFLCRIDAPKLAARGMADDALCAMIQTEVDRELALTTQATPAGQMPDSPDWVSVELRQASPVTLTAVVTQKSAGVAKAHPEFSVDVSDKTIDQSDVAMLAGEIAKAVAQAAAK
jgi:hypothetical protein